MTEPLRWVLTVAAALLGLCVGSFVNVMIFRLPRDRSVVAPRSHCFACGTTLTTWDLLPVVSVWLSGRRCRHCGTAVSAQYSWVELACGALYAAFAWRWGFSLATLVGCLVTAPLLAALVIDLRHKIIPDSLNLAVGIFGLAAAGADHWLADPRVPSLPLALAGAVLGWLVFALIVRAGRAVFHQEAMGGGDVLLAAAVGTLTGPGRGFGTFFLVGILSGAILGLALMVFGRLGRREPMAFGPFLIVGAWTVLLWPELTHWVAARYGFGGG